MFSLIRRSVTLAIAAGLMTLAPTSSAQATVDGDAESCAVVTPGRCDFTAGREGVHRIEVSLPAARADKLGELAISGQQCPLTRQAGADASGSVQVACFAYLSGGVTYQLMIPADGRVTIVQAQPAHGEPVTLIP